MKNIQPILITLTDNPKSIYWTCDETSIGRAYSLKLLDRELLMFFMLVYGETRKTFNLPT